MDTDRERPSVVRHIHITTLRNTKVVVEYELIGGHPAKLQVYIWLPGGRGGKQLLWQLTSAEYATVEKEIKKETS